MVLVGGADQREIAFIGNGENDPPVGSLKEIAPVMIEQPPCHDVTATDKPHLITVIHPDDALDDGFGPGAGRVDQHPRADLPFLPPAIKRDHPAAGIAVRPDNARSRHDGCAIAFCVTGVQYNKPRILDPAI